jgi:hypothetical protein
MNILGVGVIAVFSKRTGTEYVQALAVSSGAALVCYGMMWFNHWQKGDPEFERLCLAMFGNIGLGMKKMAQWLAGLFIAMFVQPIAYLAMSAGALVVCAVIFGTVVFVGITAVNYVTADETYRGYGVIASIVVAYLGTVNTANWIDNGAVTHDTRRGRPLSK